MYAARICPACKMKRMPEETVVKEGKKDYVVYKCRICNHQDIERLLEKPRTALWDDKWGFRDEDAPGMDINEG